MKKQLIIAVSGKKQSGKNTICNFIINQYLNKKNYEKSNIFHNDTGFISINDILYSQSITDELLVHGIKVYSFADALKSFCIDVFNVPKECCYGTDNQKNTLVDHVKWENFSYYIRWKNIKSDYNHIINKNNTTESEFWRYYADASYPYLRSGPMTAREIMQVVGTDICRKIYHDCWSNATLKLIKKENFPLSLIADARFPNEIKISKENDVKIIRLNRNVFNDQHQSETSLDNHSVSDYDLFVENSNLTISETCEQVEPHLTEWFKNHEL